MLTRDQWALATAGLFLLANAVVPAVIGDLYPFTSGPMFRDAPTRYCNYRVLGPDGKELKPETFLIHRIYDGNPVGYGVGIKPPAILEEFGAERDEAACRNHVLAHLTKPEFRDLPFVTIEQQVIGPIDSERVGVLRTDRWRVENPNAKGTN
jgi:hypothetical protein